MTTITASAFSHTISDSFEFAQTVKQGSTTIGTFTQDQGARVYNKISINANTTCWFSTRLNASGTFAVYINNMTTGDTVNVYSPTGVLIATAISNTTSSNFTIPKSSTAPSNNTINNAVVVFSHSANTTRIAGNYFDYTLIQIPQITDYETTQIFAPGAGESFTWTSTGFTCVIARAITAGSQITLANYTNTPAPCTWTLTSTNTSVFANASGNSGNAVVGSPGLVSVTPLVSSATAISPVTITLVITNIGVATCINPVPYQEPGIFWSPNASSLPALTASRKHAIDDSQRPSNDIDVDKIANKEEEVVTSPANKKASIENTTPTKSNFNLSKTSPFIIVPQVCS